MAKSRLNKKLLLILAGMLIIAIIGGWGLWEVKWRHRDPQPFIDKGDQLFAQGKYNQARIQYARARGWAARNEDKERQIIALLKTVKILPRLDIEHALAQTLGVMSQTVTLAPDNVQVREDRAELQYDVSRDSGNLKNWQNLLEYADDLVKTIELYPEEDWTLLNARAHYLQGLATVAITEIRQDTGTDILQARELAVEYFQKACELDPNTVDYCKALSQTNTGIAGLIVSMRSPLPEEDRHLAVEYWYKAREAVEQFLGVNPDSAAALTLLADSVNFPRGLAGRDAQAEAEEQTQLDTSLNDLELIESYFKAWQADSPRPVLTEIADASDRLMYDYLQQAEKLGTDVVPVQLSLADYWLIGTKADLSKAIVHLEKALENEQNTIDRLKLFLRIARTYSRNGQQQQALKACEDAFALNADVKVTRTVAVRTTLYSLHQFAAETTLLLAAQIKGSDQESYEQINENMDSAGRHLAEAMAVVDTQTDSFNALIIRGRIAEMRRPPTRESIREAIQFYEQARDQMESMGLAKNRQTILKYVNLHVTLARIYKSDGQPGAAEEALEKGIRKIQEMFPSAGQALEINPSILLLWAELQLQNRHLTQAKQTIDRVLQQISTETEEFTAEQAAISARALQLRVQQFQLEGKNEEALATLQYVAEHYPPLLDWSFEQQVRMLRRETDSEAEVEQLLRRWMSLNPNSPAPVAMLADVYLRLDRQDEALALLKGAVAENSELEEFLQRAIALIEEPDREKRQQLRREQLLQDNSNPVQQQMGLFQLYQEDFAYYSAEAAKYTRQGETDLAKESQEKAKQSGELAIEAIESAYNSQPENPSIHEALLFHYLSKEDIAKAEKLVERATEGNWDGVDGLYFIGRLHNKKGELLEPKDRQAGLDEYSKALECLEQAVRNRPTFYQAWAEKARVEAHLGQLDAALESALQAESQNPTSDLAVRILLEVTAAQWRRAKVADDPLTANRFAQRTFTLAERALTLRPGLDRAILFRLAYLDEYDADTAIEERLALLKRAPQDRSNLQALLRLYQNQNKSEQIRQLLAKLVEEQPDSPELIMLLAQQYNLNNQYTQALELLLPAQERWPNSLELTALLADVYRLNNQTAQARACLEKFLINCDPENKWNAHRTLGLLEAQLGQQNNAVKSFSLAVDSVKQAHSDNAEMVSAVVCDMARMMFIANARQQAIETVQPLADQEDLRAIELLVEFYRYSRQPDQAIVWARKGLALSPDTPRQKITLAEALIAGNEPAQAQELLEQTVEQIEKDDPSVADAYIALTNAYFMQRKYERATQVLEDATKSRGITHPNVRLQLAKLYNFQGNFTEAAEQFRQILDKHPGNMNVRQALIDLLVRQGQYARAEEKLKEGIRIEPDKNTWYQRLSALWLTRTDRPLEQRQDKALEFARQAQANSPNDPNALVKVMDVLNARSEFDRTIDFYENEIPQDSKHNYVIILSLAQAEHGRLQEAMSNSSDPPRRRMSEQEKERLRRRIAALYEQVLDKAKDNNAIHTLAVRGMVNILGIDNAITSVQTRYSKNPQDITNRILLATLLNSRGWQLIRNNQPSQAKADLGRALELLQPLADHEGLNATSQLMVYRQLASAYTNLKMYDETRETYVKILKVRPNDIQALNNLAYILTETLNKPEEALEYIELALHQNPRNYNLLDTYGWTLLQDRQIDRAIIELRKSVDIQPTAIGYYHLGYALKEAKQYERALKILRQAEALLGNEPTAGEEIGPNLQVLIRDLETILGE